jgi:hypothetical protein
VITSILGGQSADNGRSVITSILVVSHQTMVEV